MAGVVTVEARGSVAVVQLDDGKVNALSLDVVTELEEALNNAAADGADAVVMTGRTGCLTAGLDRSIMLGADRAAVFGNLRRVTGLFQTIMRLPVPTVVACSGHAIAAGALILLVADVRIGARVRSKIGLNEVQIGLPLFPLAVAAARARLDSTAFVRSTLEGAVYDYDGAVEVGYLDRTAEAADLVATAVDEAARLGQLDRPAYLATRELILAPVFAEVEHALARKSGHAPTPG